MSLGACERSSAEPAGSAARRGANGACGGTRGACKLALDVAACILKRKRPEAASCECRQVIRAHFERLGP
jgi:hypothetical protein